MVWAIGWPIRLVEIGDSIKDDLPMHFGREGRSISDDRLKGRIFRWSRKYSRPPIAFGAEKQVAVTLSANRRMAGTPPRHSEIIKWMITSPTIVSSRWRPIFRIDQVEHGSILGHYDPKPIAGTRIKAAIQEARQCGHRHRVW